MPPWSLAPAPHSQSTEKEQLQPHKVEVHTYECTRESLDCHVFAASSNPDTTKRGRSKDSQNGTNQQNTIILFSARVSGCSFQGFWHAVPWYGWSEAQEDNASTCSSSLVPRVHPHAHMSWTVRLTVPRYLELVVLL